MNAPTQLPIAMPPDSAADRLKAVALWGAGVSWLVPMLGSMTVMQHLTESDRLEFWNRLYCKVQVALTGSTWKSVVHPAVDPDRPYLFAQNHTNHFDHVTLYNATPHFKQGLELETHFSYPFYGWFMKSRGTIPVPADRERRSASIRRSVQAELDRGHSILAFPEGTRTTTGRVAPFRTGIFRIARDLGLPVAPVAVTGMYEVMRKGSLLIRAGHEVTVYVDEPIETAGVPDEEIDALAERVRAVIAARVDAYWAERGLG